MKSWTVRRRTRMPSSFPSPTLDLKTLLLFFWLKKPPRRETTPRKRPRRRCLE